MIKFESYFVDDHLTLRPESILYEEIDQTIRNCVLEL